MTKYFAAIDNRGILVRCAESADALPVPREWREIPCVEDHVSHKGIERLDRGETLVFFQLDQSYPELNSLFY